MIKKTMTAAEAEAEAEAVAVAGTGAGAASGNPLLALRSAVVQRWLAFRSAAQATHPSRALVWNVAFGLLLSWLGWHLLNWAVFNASLSSDAGSCRLSQGACWGVIQEKGRLVLMGRYPQSEQWRPLLGCLLLLTSLAAAAHPRGFGKTGLVCVLASLGSFILLLAGGVFGLAVVPTELWGGLPLTLLLAMLACLAGLPLALMLALGRRSSRLLWRCLCTSWIELIRGVPLITLLFFGAFVVPLVMPQRCLYKVS